jgi:hypothetical protein
MIVSTNKGGLANRIKSLVSCLRYGEENNVKAGVYWKILNSYENEKHILNCGFKELFENDLEVIIKEGDILYDCPCLKIFDEDEVSINFCKFKPRWKRKFIPKDHLRRDVLFSYNKMPEKVKENYKPYFKKLILKEELQQKVDTFSKQFDENTISVHIRSWCRPNEQSRSCSLFIDGIENFELEMMKYKNATFFLSTDSPDIKKYFLEESLLKNKIIMFSRTTPLENSRSLQEGLKEDLIELYLLSKNKVLIGSFNSTYSEVAWWLGGCNEKVTIL